jgi:hypothetical protein
MDTLFALTTGIAIVSKCLPEINTLAYFTRFSMMKTKSFIKYFVTFALAK